MGEPQSVDDARPDYLVNALGLSAPPGELVRVLNVDLDGGNGVDPAAVVRALLPLLGGYTRSMIATSSSGREGRFRALVRIGDTPFEQVQALGRELFERLGFDVAQGAIELYPATKNGRVPFGLGGCEVFTRDLRESTRFHPLEAAAWLDRMPRVDLQSVVEQLTQKRFFFATPPVVEPEPKREPKPSRVSNRLERSTRNREVLELLRNGVSGPGESNEALRMLVCDAFVRRLPEQKAVAFVCRWIQGGGLARSNAARNRGGLDRLIRDVPRRVRASYAALQPYGRPKPVHLTAPELVQVMTIVERAVDIDRAKLCALLLRVLPLMKCAALANRVGVTIHRDEWWKKLGGGPDYKRLRDAAGIFVATTGYLSEKRAVALGRPKGDAHAMTWTVTGFTFDATAPKRPLVSPRERSPRRILATVQNVALRWRANVHQKHRENPRNGPPSCTHISALCPPVSA